MPTKAFRELVAAFPSPSEKFRATLSTGLTYVSGSNPTFVEPDLDEVRPIEPGRTSVVLLSAPGAVGKSTLATELAHHTGSLLWDLSKFQVGSRTFSGTILEAFGNMATGVLKRLNEGEFFFVLDALDEAQIRAGSQNFDAFLEDLAATLREPRPRPVLVLLARTDTAEWIDIVLQEGGVPIARYQIDYFDQSRAFAFIERQLDERRRRDGRPSLHRQQTRPYTDARTALFELIYRLFSTSESSAWADQRVRDFLGYAPVLEALTDYLDVTNYMQFIQELQDQPPDGRDPWQFLTDVLGRLLEREQRKIGNAVRGQLEAAARAVGWSDWERLYSPAEQLARVVAYSMRLPLAPVVRLPPALDAPYEEALKTSLPQHPFLSGRRFANVVFREFAYAWGLTHGSSELANSLRETMRHREDPFLPSQLFSRFVVNGEREQMAVLDGQDFGVVYESLLSRPKKVLLSLAEVGDAVQASASLEGESEPLLEVQLLDSGSGVHFWRRLSNADIDLEVPVRLGLLEQRFGLGPSVDLRCGSLVVACDDIDVDASEGVRLHANGYASVGAGALRLRVRNQELGRLAVVWPSVAHPWASYRVDETAGSRTLGDTVQGDTLRKFILMFRRQRSRRVDTIMGVRWSPDQIDERDRLVDLAVKRGVLDRIPAPPRFVLNTEYFSLVSLVLGRPDEISASGRAFVTEYLGVSEAKRIGVAS